MTTLKGADAGAYCVEQLPNYYLDSGEPRGVWFGEGSQQLGVTGEVEDEAFLAVMAGMDPQRPDRDLGRCYDEKSVRGFDVTASAPKSVSVLWALGVAASGAPSSTLTAESRYQSKEQVRICL